MLSSQRRVFESPPVFQQSEDQVQIPVWANQFQGYQQTFRSEELPDVSECFTQVSGCVQHVGRQHQVERMGSEALLLRAPLDVEDVIVHTRVVDALPLT